MNHTLAALMLGTIALAGRSTTAGAQAVAPAPPRIPLQIVLAGQSNATGLHAPLRKAYRPGVMNGYTAPGSRIRQWAVDAPDGYWPHLRQMLHEPLRAFVWWQGENDAPYADEYADLLREFIGRTRREANNPTLLVVICRVVDDPRFARIRLIQEDFVRNDPNARLVSSDGLPTEEVVHLTRLGYEEMAERVIAALK